MLNVKKRGISLIFIVLLVSITISCVSAQDNSNFGTDVIDNISTTTSDVIEVSGDENTFDANNGFFTNLEETNHANERKNADFVRGENNVNTNLLGIGADNDVLGLDNPNIRATVSNNPIVVGENTTVSITGPDDVSGRIRFYGDWTPETIVVDNFMGSHSISVENLLAGAHRFNVTYEENDNYSSDFITGFIVVNPKPVDDFEIENETYNIDYGQDLNVVVNSGNLINEKVLIEILGDTLYTSKEVLFSNRGVATATFTGINVGNYTIRASYQGGKTYDTCSTDSKLNVYQIDTPVTITVNDLIYVRDNVDINVTLDKNTTGFAIIAVDGVENTVPVTDGSAKYTLDDVKNGTHNIVVKYLGDTNYKSNQSEKEFIAEKYDTILKIDDIEYDPTNNMTSIRITINSKGDVALDGKVTVAIKNETIDEKIGEFYIEGQTTYESTLNISDICPGQYNFTVEYEGNEFNNNSSDMDYHNIPLVTNYVLPVTATTIVYNETDVVITVTLPDRASRNKLLIVVNQTEYDSSSFNPGDDDNIVTLNISNYDAGDYSVIARYDADDIYDLKENTTSFSIIKAESYIDIEVSEDYMVDDDVEIILVGSIPTEITVTINGEEYVVNPNRTVTFTAVNGTFEIIAKLAGDENHNASETNATFYVYKLTPEFSVDPETTTIYVESNATINISGPEDRDDAVVTITGDLEAEIENFNGTFEKIFENLDVNTYNINVTYMENDKYVKRVVGATIVVIPKEDVLINVEDVSITYGENATVIVTGLDNIVGADIIIDVNGTNETVVVDDNGEARAIFDNLSAGNYVITAAYAGDVSHATNSTNADLIVNKADTTIDISINEPIYAGNDALIEVTFKEDVTNEAIITVDGEDYTVNITDGKASCFVEGIKYGEHTVVVKYLGDDNYNENTSDVLTFDVIKYTSELDISSIETDSSNNITSVNITIYDIDGGLAPVTGNVTIDVIADGDIIRTVESDVDGSVFTVDLGEILPGDYDIVVVYHGDDYYYPSFDFEEYTVPLVNNYDLTTVATDIVYNESDVVVTITLPDGGSKDDLFVIVNEVIYRGDNLIQEGNDVTFNISGLDVGEYSVEAYYRGNDVYAEKFNTTSFTVSKAPSSIEIDVLDSYIVRDNVVITFIPSISSPITVTINDMPYEVSDDNTITLTVVNGTYTILAKLDGDKNHIGSEANATFVVNKVAPETSIATEDVVVDNNEIVVVTVPDDATGVVLFVFNGQNYYADVENGKATFTLSDLPVGNYSIKYTYYGDDKYLDNSGTGEFEVFINDTYEITATADPIKVGENAIINVELPKDATGEVIIAVEGKNYTALVENGKATVNVPDLTAGDHIADVNYLGNDKYAPKLTDVSISVSKIENASIYADSKPVEFGEDAIVDVVLPKDANGTIIVNVGGKNYTAQVKNGKATVNIPDLAIGDYDADVIYSGDDKYESVSTTVLITINKVSNFNMTAVATDIVYNESDVVVTITLPDGGSKDDLFVIVNEVIYRGDNLIQEGNDVTFNISGLDVGEYSVEAYYRGNDVYAEKFNTTSFTVSKAPSSIEIDVLDSYIVRDNVVITFIPSISSPITVTINDMPYEVSDDNTITLTVVNGTYTILAKLDGDKNHIGSEANATFVVNKVAPETSIATEDVVVDNNEIVVVTVPDDATGVVLFVFNGQNYYADVENGKATFTLSDLPVGNYSIKYTYYGDDKYLDNSGTGEFEVFINDTYEITATADPIKVGENAIINVELPKDATGEVIIAVEGKNYTALVENGKATVNVPDLTAGDHIADVNYLGNDKYAPKLTDVSISVSKIENASIYADSKPVEFGEDAIVDVVLPKDANGTIIVNVGGKNYTAQVKNGKATVNIPDLAIGDYDADVIYSGDDKYESVSTTVPITINKVSNVNMTASADTIFVGENAIINVKLPEDATGMVVANIGKDLYAAVVENGVAEITVPNLEMGNYTSTVTYSGDDKYEPVNTTVNIDVEGKLEVIAPNVDKYYHGPERFVVYVLLGGKPLANKTVELTINNVVYTRTTNENGIASLGLNLNSGNYTMIVKVDDIELDSLVTIYPTIVGNDITKIFRNGTQYFATFYDSNGNALANTAVTFNINGVFYNRTTDSNGVAKLNINLNPGIYIITAYNLVTGEMKFNTITVLSHFIEHSDFNKVYGTPDQFTIKICDDMGNVAGAGEVVTFNIHGVFYNRVTDANGFVRLNINLMPGQYIITSYYKNEAVSDVVTVRAR